jgi:hypothetical protein
MRGPLRDRQQFECPDCGVELFVRIEGVSCEVLINETQATIKPANKGASKSPQVVAWSVVGILVVGFGVFLLTGSEEAGPVAGTAKETAAVEPSETLEPPTMAVPDSEVAAPLVEQQPESTPVAAAEDSDLEPEEPPPIAVNNEPTPDDIMPPAPEPTAPPLPSPEERAAAERLAREQADMAVMQDKLSLKLIAYSSAKDADFGTFLDEVAALSGVRIDRSGIADTKFTQTISVSGEDVSIAAILDQAARQAGVRYEVLRSGISLRRQ